MSTDPHADLRRRVIERVVAGDGESSRAVRAAAARGADLPADLQPLVEKIHRHAYRVTDTDIETLQATYSDDQLFEIIVSAALGASERRLQAGLTALDEACG
jgi:hypothetical protein